MGTRQLRARIPWVIGGTVAGVLLLGGGIAAAVSQSVTIADFSFSPATVTVSVRDTVTWTNTSGQVHTATADDGSWNAGNIAGDGGTGAVVFPTAGTFPYHCTIHPQMTGTVIVEGDAATATTAPSAGATMRPTDAAPITGADRGSGAGMLTSLAIGALALAVAAAVLRRRPAAIITSAVTVETAPAGFAAPSTEPASLSSEGGSADRSLAPFVLVAVAGAVAVAVVWRRLTSSR